MIKPFIVGALLLSGVVGCQYQGSHIIGPSRIEDELGLRTRVPLVTDVTMFSLGGMNLAFLTGAPTGGGFGVLVHYHVYRESADGWIRCADGTVDGVMKLRARIDADSLLIEGRVPGVEKWELKKRLSFRALAGPSQMFPGPDHK